MGFDMNSGYVGYSISRRAADAYRSGERPRSKWTKNDMLDAIKGECGWQEIEYPKGLEKLTRDALFDKLFYRSSWHHTSKYCNDTDFYELDEEVVSTLTEKQVSEWLEEQRAERRKAAKATQDDPTEARYVRLRFTEWVGCGRNKKAVDQDGWGVLEGKWCHLTQPSENDCNKKNVEAGNCKVVRHFSTEREMLEDQAVSRMTPFDNLFVSATVKGEPVRAFVRLPWLHVVSEDGKVTRRKVCASNQIKVDSLVFVYELKGEKDSQSETLLALRERHYKHCK